MQIKKTLIGVIKKFDLFSQHITFRYNEEPAYESVTGGCISIILIIFFLGIFSTTLLRTIDKEYINFNLSRYDLQSPSYFSTTLENTFMFAVGIDGLDMNTGQRYFDVYMQKRHNEGSSRKRTPVQLIQCYREQWESRGYGAFFYKLGLEKWLCPPEGTSIELEGKFTSDSFKFYKIAATKCNSALNPSRPCVSDAIIESFLDANQAFNFNYYFVNTIINPGNEEYLKTYLEDRNYFPFSPTDGINANLFISSFTIETDQSLWPNQDIDTDQGGIVLEEAQVMNYKVRGNEYFKLYLRKSPIALSISRSFRKVDDTLSYIGGLFGTILVFFGFVSMYNELSYEIEITRSAFYYDKNDPFDGTQFNLLVFFVYVFFEFLDRFGITLPWQRFQRLHRFLEEGKKQLDMKLIMNKILYAERLGLALLDKSKHKALLLSEPFTLDEADEIRKDLNFYKSFRKKFFPNGESVEQNGEILQYDVSKNNPNMDQLVKQQGLGHSKVYPLGDNSIIEPTSTQFLETGRDQAKRLFPYKIEDQEEFSQLDVEVKQCMEELQEEADKKDDLARRILEKIDSRIKKRYLKSGGKSPKKLKPINYAHRESVNISNLDTN